MKQRVATKAIIKKDGKVLLLRRTGGRPSIDGLFELPGGKVHIHQQPEDALAGALKTHTGLHAETLQLDDVITFIDPDDRELQYVFIVYIVGITGDENAIKLSDEYDKYIWKQLSEIQLNAITQSTQQLLGLTAVPVLSPSGTDAVMIIDDKNATKKTLIGYSDGGSRGNPGPSASGFVLMNDRSEIIYEGGAFLGITTNNVAEYQAVYLALEKARELGADIVEMRLDSQLVVNQMNGVYKIKHLDLAVIRNRILQVAATFEKVTYSHVYREYNQLADGMVNKILDQQTT